VIRIDADGRARCGTSERCRADSGAAWGQAAVEIRGVAL